MKKHAFVTATALAFGTQAHRMPTWYYVTPHPDAKLTPADFAALTPWAKDVSAPRP